jgi:hypothetical protein
MENQESTIEWYQAKARLPKKLHQPSKIALAKLNKSLAEVFEEALERIIAEAGVQ